MYNKRKSGFSLMELLIALSIVSSIIISFFYFYPKIKNSNNINNEVININTIITGISNLYNDSNNFNGLSNKILIDARIIPNLMLSNKDDEILNSWGGKVKISSYKVSNQLSLISIKYENIPQSQCALFISSIEKNFIAIRTDVEYMQGNYQKTSFIKNNYRGISFSVNNASSGCSQKNNNITFYTK